MRKQLTSYHGLIKNVYAYGEEIFFRILKINSGIEFVKIELISLNTNDCNVKRTRFKTDHYTDDYKKGKQ